MENILRAGSDIETELQNAPDDVAEEFEKWQLAELKREECEARLYTQFKSTRPEITATELKSLINADASRHNARLSEIVAQKGYERVSKRFMSLMKRADLRGRSF